MSVDIQFSGPRNGSVRDIGIEFGDDHAFAIVRVPETSLNTWTKYDQWARTHESLGKEVLDAVWHFCQHEYQIH